MKDFDFKFIGKYNVYNLLDILNKKSEGDWNYWTVKQNKFPVHSQTKTIPLIVDEQYGYFGDKKGIKSKFYDEFENELLNIKKILEDNYGKGDILTIEIANLPQKSKVDEHTDKGVSLQKNPRIHLVLQTNENVIFKVGNYLKHMILGEMWEINNSKPHSVINDGNTDRLHMIIDYKIVKESLM